MPDGGTLTIRAYQGRRHRCHRNSRSGRRHPCRCSGKDLRVVFHHQKVRHRNRFGANLSNHAVALRLGGLRIRRREGNHLPPALAAGGNARSMPLEEAAARSLEAHLNQYGTLRSRRDAHRPVPGRQCPVCPRSDAARAGVVLEFVCTNSTATDRAGSRRLLRQQSPKPDTPTTAPPPSCPPKSKTAKKKPPSKPAASSHKVVVRNGGAKDESPQLAPGMSEEQAQHSRETTARFLPPPTPMCRASPVANSHRRNRACSTRFTPIRSSRKRRQVQATWRAPTPLPTKRICSPTNW